MRIGATLLVLGALGFCLFGAISAIRSPNMQVTSGEPVRMIQPGGSDPDRDHQDSETNLNNSEANQNNSYVDVNQAQATLLAAQACAARNNCYPPDNYKAPMSADDAIKVGAFSVGGTLIAFIVGFFLLLAVVVFRR